MSSTGDKYKLKITNIGVGDPFASIQIQFYDADENHTDPSVNRIKHLKVSVSAGTSTTNGSPTYNDLGSAEMHYCESTGPYTFGLPMDWHSFSPSVLPSNIYLKIELTGENPDTGEGVDIHVENGMGDSDPNKFETTLSEAATQEVSYTSAYNFDDPM